MATVIPKQPKKEREQITIKLDREVLQNLEHYCRYLESSRDYVINQCLVFIFRKDRPFSEWLSAQGIAVPVEPNGPGEGQAASTAAMRKKRSVPNGQGRLAIEEPETNDTNRRR